MSSSQALEARQTNPFLTPVRRMVGLKALSIL
jgi:hypothetical protein